MQASFKTRIASRGWHVYMKSTWKEPKKGEAVFAENDFDRNAVLADSFAVAWKRKLVTKLTADVVGHLPREVSRAVWFFIDHGGSLAGKVHSPRYYPSPIAAGGLEIMIACEFKICTSKLAFLERMKQIIEKKYRDPLPLVNPAESLQIEEEDSDSEDEIVFLDDVVDVVDVTDD